MWALSTLSPDAPMSWQGRKGKSSLIQLKDLEKIRAAILGMEAPEQKLKRTPRIIAQLILLNEWMIWYSMILYLQVMFAKFNFFLCALPTFLMLSFEKEARQL